MYIRKCNSIANNAAVNICTGRKCKLQSVNFEKLDFFCFNFKEDFNDLCKIHGWNDKMQNASYNPHDLDSKDEMMEQLSGTTYNNNNNNNNNNKLIYIAP